MKELKITNNYSIVSGTQKVLASKKFDGKKVIVCTGKDYDVQDFDLLFCIVDNKYVVLGFSDCESLEFVEPETDSCDTNTITNALFGIEACFDSYDSFVEEVFKQFALAKKIQKNNKEKWVIAKPKGIEPFYIKTKTGVFYGPKTKRKIDFNQITAKGMFTENEMPDLVERLICQGNICFIENNTRRWDAFNRIVEGIWNLKEIEVEETNPPTTEQLSSVFKVPVFGLM